MRPLHRRIIAAACSLAAMVVCPRLPCAAGAPNSSANPHWSFVAPKPVSPPHVTNTRWVRNPIDAFVLARLEQDKVKPSPEADRVTLIRRLSFDLIGLPPSADEVRAFVQDRRPDAYTRLVDRLLGSPHFGEQWGRHWLDLARYADSDGYEKDGVRPYAYLYRDWVIDALNRDLPFDQFTIEQLAGDLLPGATFPQKTATGFHRQTLTNKEGGVDQEEFRTKAVVDRVNTTAAVWLGLTVACAECHDHKYDPISQREYYQLYAFFNNASEKDLPIEVPGADTPPSSDSAKDKKDSKTKTPTAAVLVEEAKPRETRIHVRGDFLRRGDSVQPGTLRVLHSFAGHGTRPNRLDLAQWLVDPANPLTARVTVNRIWRHLFGRGLVPTLDDFGTRGDPPSHPELLDWLANEFINAEVEKLQSYKVSKIAHEGGDAPCNDATLVTHATRARPWSQKALIRLILHSATYRQASVHRSELTQRDPLNVLLARQGRFRLDAENVRDAWLSASGLLTRSLGGPSVRPPLPADIAAIGYAGSIKWQNSEGSDRYRRGLYVFFQRTVPYPMLTTFDAPDSTAACTRRERSNTPLQALTLLNDPVFFECAEALGRRMKSVKGDTAFRFAFEQCLGRSPTRDELARLQQLCAAHSRLSSVEDSLVATARVVMNLDEFVTRE